MCNDYDIHSVRSEIKNKIQVCSMQSQGEALEFLHQRNSIGFFCCKPKRWAVETDEQLQPEPCRDYPFTRTHFIFKR